MISQATTSRLSRSPAWRTITRRRSLALASKKVRYVGEAVVAVIAEDRYLAEDALELIEIEYAAAGRGHRPRIRALRRTRRCFMRKPRPMC